MKAIIMAVFCFISFSTFAQRVVESTEVEKYVGDTVVVCGKVFTGRFLESSNRKPTLLNLGDKYPNQHLTVVIYEDSRNKFGYKPEESLINKKICITGKVEMYKGKPQIVVADPFQIKLH